MARPSRSEIQNAARIHQRRFAASRATGWFVEKKGDSPRNDTLVFFPAQKKRAKIGRKKTHA
jgi:hypothetical protein